MNLQFVTSISQSYWNSVAKYCIGTWNLPGELIVYIDQPDGDIEWFSEIEHKKRLVHVPSLKFEHSLKEDEDTELDGNSGTKTKVRKFWGKTCAQLHAVRNRPHDTRIVWLDADMEQQVPHISETLFDFQYHHCVSIMKSGDWVDDRWETGLVIFNQEHPKLDLFMNQYEKYWKDKEKLSKLWRPYDAQVLGKIAEMRGYHNLVTKPCENKDALEHTRFRHYFKHWINKDNKKLLQKKIVDEN
jgi:hypothetical protein